jgi:hypothetical protein
MNSRISPPNPNCLYTRFDYISGIRKGLNNQLRHAQELRGVVTSLEATDQTQAIINGNQKILVAFYKWLAKEGLSEKMQHEHHTNIRDRKSVV